MRGLLVRERSPARIAVVRLDAPDADTTVELLSIPRGVRV